MCKRQRCKRKQEPDTISCNKNKMCILHVYCVCCTVMESEVKFFMYDMVLNHKCTHNTYTNRVYNYTWSHLCIKVKGYWQE